MRYVKFDLGRTAKTFEVNKESFEKITNNKEPWEQLQIKGEKKKQYAICPCCDNPVRLIGLYRVIKKRPYGAHAGKDIKGLPIHNQFRYEYCSLSKKGKKINDEEQYIEADKIQKELYYILRDNFHKIVYFIENKLGFEGSNSFWEKRLNLFMGTGGYLYPWISLENLPWMFCYFGIGGTAIYNQNIKCDTSIYNCILENCKKAQLLPVKNTKYFRLQNNGEFLEPIKFRFSLHQAKLTDEGELLEELTMYIGFGSKEIYKEIIIIDQSHFRKLLDYDWHDNARWMEIRAMSAEIMKGI